MAQAIQRRRTMAAAVVLALAGLGAAPSRERVPTLAVAFAAAYPNPVQQIVWEGRAHEAGFSPFALYPLERGVVALVSKGVDPSNGHGNEGFYSVVYLTRQGRGWRTGEVLVGRGSDGGYGRPPIIETDRSLSRHPTLRIVSTHQGTGEGVTSVDLVQLGARPRVVAEGIALKLTDENGVHRGPFRCAIYGRIEPGRADRSFTVRYAGDYRGRVVWSWAGDHWRSAAPNLDLYAKCPRT